MIKKIDYITYEYNQVYQTFYNILKDYVQKNKNNEPNISLIQTDKILSYIYQDKTGLVKYPFVTIELIPRVPQYSGGQYDYQRQGNQELKIKYYENEDYNLLFNQNIPLRTQKDLVGINVNLWGYSYQEISLLRNVLQRTFTIPGKKYYIPIDLTKYIIESIDTNDRITQELLSSLNVTYNVQEFLTLQGVMDSSPRTITNELPIKKFTVNFNCEMWLPTDIDIPDINGLIEDIRLTFNIGNNIQESQELIKDKQQLQNSKLLQFEYNIKK